VQERPAATAAGNPARFNQKDTDFVLTLAPNDRIFNADPKIILKISGSIFQW
jgi:hypothetical protein